MCGRCSIYIYEIDQKYVEIIETIVTIEINGQSVPYTKLTARIDYTKARFFDKEDAARLTALGFTHVQETRYFYLRATEFTVLKVNPIELNDNRHVIEQCFTYDAATVTALNNAIYND